MRRHVLLIASSLALVVAASACDRTKSANPLSPQIAGPIGGVEIVAPALASPQTGAQVSFTAQPLSLVVNNSTSTGVRPLTYVFEIAMDVEFNNKILTQNGVTPGDARTEWKVPQVLGAERTYFWRAKADDGANASEWMAAAYFTVFTPVLIGVPGPISPADGAQLATRRPTLEVSNASVSGPAGEIRYQFEVSTNAIMSERVASATEAWEGSGRTSWTVPDDLAASTRHYWRARAFDYARVGEWTPIRSFVTSAIVVAPPPPPPPPGGGNPPVNANDQLNWNDITIVLGENVRNWSVTSAITSVRHIGNDLCIDHTKAGQWPRVPWFDDPSGALVEGNQWFIANVGGRWLAGANEWLRPGQTCKDVGGHVGQGGFGGTALANWTPQPGETLGVMMSTPARAGQWSTAERSNIVVIKW